MPDPTFVYFEEVSIGEERWSPELVVEGAEMLEYARRNDPWPFHFDEAAAKEGLFGGIISSGGYTLTLMLRLHHQVVNAPDYRWKFLAGFDWGEVKFPNPVRPGDKLRMRIEVLAKQLSRKPGRGRVQYRIEVINQDDAPVLSFVCIALLGCRDPNARADNP